MTVVARAECDLCGCGGPTLDVDVTTTDALRADEGLVDGSEFGVPDAHPSCLAIKRSGGHPERLAGWPGMVSVDDVEPT